MYFWKFTFEHKITGVRFASAVVFVVALCIGLHKVDSIHLVPDSRVFAQTRTHARIYHFITQDNDTLESNK